LGVSIAELAARVGTSKQEIGHLELGKRQLTIKWLVKLAGALDCHPWDIVSREPPPELSPAEAQLLSQFRSMSKRARQALLSQISSGDAEALTKNKRSK
jgi:DNA-binding Xre family transcriptional regulator